MDVMVAKWNVIFSCISQSVLKGLFCISSEIVNGKPSKTLDIQKIVHILSLLNLFRFFMEMGWEISKNSGNIYGIQ